MVEREKVEDKGWWNFKQELMKGARFFRKQQNNTHKTRLKGLYKRAGRKLPEWLNKTSWSRWEGSGTIMEGTIMAEEEENKGNKKYGEEEEVIIEGYRESTPYKIEQIIPPEPDVKHDYEELRNREKD